MKKNILLVIILAAIAGGIWYLESQKAQPLAMGNQAERAISILLPADSTGAASSSGPSTTHPSLTLSAVAAADKKNGYKPAIEIAGPTGFINASDTFTLSGIVGKKVILVDFWTYSCINCIRTLPYLTDWYRKYHDQGLEIVGIHTPEFEFEKDINNVESAAKKFGIHYPVVLDSNYGTWRAYGNLYWPHEYLIDIAGYAVHDQIGEGNYDETEKTIQDLLKQRTQVMGDHVAITGSITLPGPNDIQTMSPETYFGAARNEYLGNGVQSETGTQVLADPQSTRLNDLYLSGSWNFQNEFATNNDAGAKVFYTYDSAKVFFVANAPVKITVEVLQDGKPISATNAGSDVHNGKMVIKESRLYNVVDNHGSCTPDGVCTSEPAEHTLELIIDSPGLQAYTFTFG